MRVRTGIMTLALVAAPFVGAACGGSGDGGSDRQSGSTEPNDQASADPPAAAAVIAHRGASGYAPEHTFAAYDLAVDQGADYLEQDLQLTSDGVLVVLHDATLDRTARGPAASCTGPVADKTFAQISECEVGTWFNEAYPDRADPEFADLRIPSMEQVIDRYGSEVRYYIEIKAMDVGSGMEQPLVDLLDAAGLLDPPAGERPVIVQSFGADVLETVHDLAPDLPLVQLVLDLGTRVEDATLERATNYAVGIGPPRGVTDEALVKAADDRCLEVHPYTVDEPAEMVRLLVAGVDGFFTNLPDVARTAADGQPRPPEHCGSRASG